MVGYVTNCMLLKVLFSLMKLTGYPTISISVQKDNCVAQLCLQASLQICDKRISCHQIKMCLQCAEDIIRVSNKTIPAVNIGNSWYSKLGNITVSSE